MDITSGLAAASNALSIADWLRNVGKNYDAAEYKLKIADLLCALADAKLALNQAKENELAHANEVARLKESFERKGTLVRARHHQYFSDAEGQPTGYPVCPSCLVSGVLVETVPKGNFRSSQCPACDKDFSPITGFRFDPDTGATNTDEEARRKSAADSAKMESFGRQLG